MTILCAQRQIELALSNTAGLNMLHFWSLLILKKLKANIEYFSLDCNKCNKDHGISLNIKAHVQYRSLRIYPHPAITVKSQNTLLINQSKPKPCRIQRSHIISRVISRLQLEL